ncbi:ribonuclease Oy-like [Harmonia axyridis]|uniref:ribonuclease Oy-like n=1 Tax=Harmonia axyridis TaxID=115357 RepID=UPI001E276D28|nr:ribonuclease Oy-like [Harmonia axyridis]
MFGGLFYQLFLTTLSHPELPCDNNPKLRGCKNPYFNQLQLAQQWPVTECLMWKKIRKTNSCNMPKNTSIFTIHGLWPSNTHGAHPEYCDSDLKFSRRILAPIINDMKERWTDIHANINETSFWNYEWKKHGTCAQTLASLNGVFKYFRKGLQLHRQYDIFAALKKRNIIPGGSFDLKAIYDAIFHEFRAHPIITLKYISKFGYFLHEIRLCFDKSLRIENCTKPMNDNLNVKFPK